MIDSLLQRAMQLIERRRYKEAEKSLVDALSLEPTNITALSLLALCKYETEKINDALILIKQAVGLDPDNDHLLYLHALFSFRADDLRNAEQMIKNAIAFNPANANYHGLMANIKLHQRAWQEALDQANIGLSIEAENLECLNARATALLKLDKKTESFDTIREALQQDPENDNTHSNIGWSQLESGEVEKALESFRNALRFNPQNEFAKSGMVEALKARYLFYKWFLKYAFWINNLKAKGQWFFIVGMFIGVRVLSELADNNSDYAPFIKPIVYVYFAFAISTWIIEPLSNLVLRFNIFGRYALTRHEIIASNFVGFSFGLAAITAVAFMITEESFFLILMLYFTLMMLPFGSMLRPNILRNRQILIGLTVIIGTIGLIGIFFTIAWWYFFIFGIFSYQWVANALTIR